MRTGVPVFMRPAVMPCRVMLSVRWCDAGSAHRPPSSLVCPMCISPLRNVPAVMMTALARMSTSIYVLTPHTRLPPLLSSTRSSFTWSCQMLRFSWFSSTCRHSAINFMRSHCALGLHIAGPLERLSIRYCIAERSVTSPMCPPKASISRTICPLAMPPTAGLHDIWAILFMSIVTRHVFAPSLAQAAAASQPACPAPTTTMS